MPFPLRALLRSSSVALGLASSLGAQPNYPERCGLRIPASEVRAYVGLPTADVFCPLIADPKATRSFLSYQRTRGDDSLRTIGSVGIGDQIGLARWGTSAAGNGVQLSLSGAIFAQFDLGADSYDLLNADYIVGIPLTIRRNAFSMRLRIYHQSSHLGDEFLLRSEHPERENLSFESAEGLVSIDAGAVRFYGGGEWLFNRAPQDLERSVARAGAELRPRGTLIPLGRAGRIRFIAAGDLKSSEEADWKPSVSIRAGLEFEGDPPARRWSLMFESYTGPSPYGQFFRNQLRYIGVGAHFTL
jgi:hypothetical protein